MHTYVVPPEVSNEKSDMGVNIVQPMEPNQERRNVHILCLRYLYKTIDLTQLSHNPLIFLRSNAY